jgi:hypothetical protein
VERNVAVRQSVREKDCVGKRLRIATGSRIFHEDDVALARLRHATVRVRG